ncbi:unnamed protein product, partial [Cylicocyclus nassatus]
MITWAQFVFLIVTSLTLPLYIAMMIVIWRRPTLSVFHILMLSQGVADIYSVLCYDFFVILRRSSLCDEFFWDNRYLLANAAIITINHSLFLRCT